MVEADAFEQYGNRGDGPDGRGNCFGYDAEHPDYGDDDYHCASCGSRLTEQRDGAAIYHPFKEPLYLPAGTTH